MRKFLTILKWDLILLQRNKLITLGLVVAAMYLGLFFLLKGLGDVTGILVLLIFNDPVVTGYMFAGVVLLMERDTHTLQALLVSPWPARRILLSKSIALAIISFGSALLLSFAAHGFAMNYLHFTAGVLGTSLFFIFCGFYVAGFVKSFNYFLIFTIAFLVPMGLPFLPFYGLGNELWFLVLPSFAGLKLISGAYLPLQLWEVVYGYTYLLLWIFISFWLAAGQLHKKKL